MFDGFLAGLARAQFLPHGSCFQWNKPLIALHVVSDSLIALSYYSIPFALGYFIMRRADLVYRWMFTLFALFILACGTSHVLDVWTLWHPSYVAQGGVKAATALLSTATAVSLWGLIPRALALPSPSQLASLANRLGQEIASHEQAVYRLNTEIFERKCAEDALRASEQRLELALMGADLGLWDWNIQTGAVIYSDRWATMLGYAPHEIAPKVEEWRRLLHPEDMALVQARLEAHFRGDTPFYEAEHRLLTKDGEWLWVLTRGKVFEWDASGRPLRAAGTHMDITPRKRLEVRLQQQQDELCYAQRLTTAGELAATMAHELNQPLGAISNYAGGAMLRFRKLFEATPELGELMDTMLKLANRASEVVSGIRDLVRKHELRREQVRIDAMLQEVLPLIHGDVQRKSVRFHLDVEPDLPPVWGQSVYLQQLVLNLVLNAMDAMDEAAVQRRELILWARITASRSQIEIGVSDSGPGFAPEVVDRLFQPFVSTKRDGIGLGLSVCRTIVEAHAGRLWADSTPGEGVTWHVLLPVSAGRDDHEV